MCAAFFHVFFEHIFSFFHGDLQLLGTFAATARQLPHKPCTTVAIGNPPALAATPLWRREDTVCFLLK